MMRSDLRGTTTSTKEAAAVTTRRFRNNDNDNFNKNRSPQAHSAVLPPKALDDNVLLDGDGYPTSNHHYKNHYAQSKHGTEDDVSFFYHACDPTEQDLTETEQNYMDESSWHNNNNNGSHHNNNATVQVRVVASGNNNRSNNTTAAAGDTDRDHAVDQWSSRQPTQQDMHVTTRPVRHAHDIDDDDGLFTMEMLIEMLAHANRPDAYTLRRRLKAPNRDLRMEDLADILSHINLCEASHTQPRWDVIYELAYGKQHQQQQHHQHQLPSTNAAVDVPTMTTRQKQASANRMDTKSESSASPQSEKDGELSDPEDALYHALSSSPNNANNNNDDSQSLSLGQVMGHHHHHPTASAPELGSGSSSVFTLDANTHSVDSSVTWYEGGDITEIEISEDDLEEFLPPLRYDDNGNIVRYDSDEEDDSDGDSTPPPPPDMDILYTPPPLDVVLSLGEEDSLSKCYRRRRHRQRRGQPQPSLDDDSD